MTVNEKIKRLLNTRKKRVVAAVALVFVLFAVALLLYIILQSERKIKETKKDVAGKKTQKGCPLLIVTTAKAELEVIKPTTLDL